MTEEVEEIIEYTKALGSTEFDEDQSISIERPTYFSSETFESNNENRKARYTYENILIAKAVIANRHLQDKLAKQIQSINSAKQKLEEQGISV